MTVLRFEYTSARDEVERAAVRGHAHLDRGGAVVALLGRAEVGLAAEEGVSEGRGGVVRAPGLRLPARAARPIVTGQPGCDFRAAVVDGRGVPWVTEPDAEVPERVVLSAIIHGDEPGGERVVAAAVATLRIMVDEDRRSQYHWILWECSGDAMRRRLEELMDIGTVLAQTTKGRELIAQGEAQGEARGKEIGKEIGEAIGEARGFTTALFAVLEARGLAVSEAQRARVLACEDPAVLQRWVTRAATAATTADALE
jgi:hypothetical protein